MVNLRSYLGAALALSSKSGNQVGKRGAVRRSNSGTAECGGSSHDVLDNPNELCFSGDQWTDVYKTSACCGNFLVEAPIDSMSTTSSSSSDSGDAVCKSVALDRAFCDVDSRPDCETLVTDASGMLIEIDFAAVDDNCCRTCKCFGDPECVAFDGTMDEWILCDGRVINKDGVCRQKEERCIRNKDHMGNACAWLRSDPEYNSFDEDGSPCQPDFTNSGQPELEMYYFDGFGVTLTIGERGVTTDVKVKTKNSVFTLNSDECFENDSQGSSASSAGGWVSSSGTFPDAAFVSSSSSDMEITWSVMSAELGMMMNVTCARTSGSEGRTRIDVHGLTETQNNRPGVGGFCETGKIDKGKSHNVAKQDLHEYCLYFNAPLISACRNLVIVECDRHTLNQDIHWWCSNADIAKSSVGDNVAACENALKQGTDADRTKEWMKLVCEIVIAHGEMEGPDVDVEECMIKIDQFKWETFVDTYGNGVYPANGGDSGTSEAKCAKDVSEYTKKPEDQDCSSGVSVEYHTPENGWQELFFIPEDLPPCNDQLRVTAAEHREMFLHPIQFKQCGMEAGCLLDKECQPTPGFEVRVKYDAQTCESQRPDCLTCKESSERPQRICESPSTQEAGSCETCCEQSTLTPGENQCRDIRIATPYCDINNPEEEEKCESLKNKNGKLELTFTVDEEAYTMTCCKECSCFGDPFCKSFSGANEKWIICDGRNDNCKVKEDVCLTQKDHAGKTCVYDHDLSNQIGSHRASIGAYGSPCQPAWNTSGPATMEMYGAESFKISLGLGERAVITEMFVKSGDLKYTIHADKCFDDDAENAMWEQTAGASTPPGDEFDMHLDSADGFGERMLTFTHKDTNIVVSSVCLRSEAHDGHVGGYRFNVDVFETDIEGRIDTGTGFCASDKIEEMKDATHNPVVDVCNENSADANLLCKALGGGTCVGNNQVKHKMKTWCADAAHRLQTMNANQCKNYITVSDQKLGAARWEEMYCEATYNKAAPGETLPKWKEQCISKLQNTGYTNTVLQMGDGTEPLAADSCGKTAGDYAPRTDKQKCELGVEIQYQDTNGDWQEVLFVPRSKPLCDDTLTIPASKDKYFPLFTRPIRFWQCDLATDECPFMGNERAYCAAKAGYSVKYEFSQDASVCADAGGQA
ncbi:Uncharacterized protein SCF082_LOCUS17454 [Durusdinium trenchii]|uniref:Uncharacterized protein n=1 Tax=Durusdinium trenchii TaxID=1381693 RepID=A0ABP0KHP5_9DINO